MKKYVLLGLMVYMSVMHSESIDVEVTDPIYNSNTAETENICNMACNKEGLEWNGQ